MHLVGNGWGIRHGRFHSWDKQQSRSVPNEPFAFYANEFM
jgi:hypothetical protein